MKTKVRFVLDEQAWQDFMDILEREPQEMPTLKALLAKPSVFRVPEDV